MKINLFLKFHLAVRDSAVETRPEGNARTKTGPLTRSPGHTIASVFRKSFRSLSRRSDAVNIFGVLRVRIGFFLFTFPAFRPATPGDTNARAIRDLCTLVPVAVC